MADDLALTFVRGGDAILDILEAIDRQEQALHQEDIHGRRARHQVWVVHPVEHRSRHPRPSEIFFLVEATDTTLRFDRREKVPRYALAGIAETWLLDIPGRLLEVHRDPSRDGYTATTVLRPDESVSPQAFPDVVLDIADLIG